MKYEPRFLILAVALLTPLLAQAQATPTAADVARAVEDSRTIVQTERKLIVSRVLDLTAEEAGAFWPVYDRYAADMKAAGDLRVKLIMDFAEHYDSMSPDKATQLLADAQKYEQKLLDVRKKNVRQLKKVLPPIKLARFYQLESKLSAIANFVLADQIPLIE